MAWHVVEEKVSGHAPHYNIKSDADKWEVAQNIFTVENARLIAAAPDLLEIVERYADWIEGPDREEILAVIANIRGGEDATDN